MTRLLHLSFLIISLALISNFRGYNLKSTQPVTCIGITTKGKPCSKKPQSESSYCFWHDPSRVKCQGINSSGKRCAHSPVVGSTYCAIHDPNRLKCKALNNRGRPCQNSPIDSSGYCQDHIN